MVGGAKASERTTLREIKSGCSVLVPQGPSRCEAIASVRVSQRYVNLVIDNLRS